MSEFKSAAVFEGLKAAIASNPDLVQQVTNFFFFLFFLLLIALKIISILLLFERRATYQQKIQKMCFNFSFYSFLSLCFFFPVSTTFRLQESINLLSPIPVANKKAGLLISKTQTIRNQ